MTRLLSLLLLLAGCNVPLVPVDSTPTPGTRIEGEVAVEVDGGAPGGPAILLRYRCDDPPPPAGTGTPEDFVVVQENRFQGGRAPFIFPQVPAESCWLLTGFLDRDRDFNYALSATGQVTKGDVGIAPVQVETGAADGEWIDPVLGVLLRADRVVPFDRPAFTLSRVGAEEPGASMPVGPRVGSTPTLSLDLEVAPFLSDLIDQPDPIFTLVLGPDDDGDGWPDDRNGDGAPDVLWPRVLFFKLDPADPSGLTKLDPPVVLPGVVLPFDPAAPLDPATDRIDQARAAGLAMDGAGVLPVTSLRVALPPLVVTDLQAATTADLEAVAAGGVDVLGGYQILVMNSSGQLWSQPNELAGLGVPGQDLRLELVDGGDPAEGRIEGTAAFTTADLAADAYVVRFDCDAPPPPQGSGAPLDLSVIRASDRVDGVGTFAFDNVPFGSCSILLGFADVDGDFSPFYSVTQGATSGDLLLDSAVVVTGDDGSYAPVALSEQGPVPLDAPAFTYVDDKSGAPGGSMALGPVAGSTPTSFLHLSARGVDSVFGRQEDPLFTLVFEADWDGDGWPDDLNGDGLPDVRWPRVLALRLDPTDPLRLRRADPPVVLPGVVLPLDPRDAANPATNVVFQAMAAGLPFDGAQVIPLTELTVAIPPLVVTDLASRSTAPIEQVAQSGVEVEGSYQLVVMNSSGQVWTLPNEVAVLEGGQDATFEVTTAAPGTREATSITGTLTVDPAAGEPTGPGVVLRFDCAAPPPPAGSGRPLDLALVTSFSGGEGDFGFTEVPAGSCSILTGFVDNDGDFDAFYDVTAGATAGDVAIEAVVVTVGEADATGAVAPLSQDLSAVQVVPLERPSFTLSDAAGGDAPTMQLGTAPWTTQPVTITLSAEALDTIFTQTVDPVFGVVFGPDLDGDPFGLPDDTNGDGLPDALWPRILLRKLDPSDPSDGTVADPPVILPGVILTLDPQDPFNPATSLVAAALGAGIDPNSPHLFPVTDLTVVVPGLVVTSLDPLELSPIEPFGAQAVGRYQVLVMNSTGQTWAVPNELAAFGLPDQGAVFRVEAP